MTQLNITMANGRVRYVGDVENNKLILLKKPEHFFIKYQGFGISTVALAALIRENINDIVIHYLGLKGVKSYKATVMQFVESDKSHVFTDDGGEDRQKFLSVKELQVL